jgi:hypothetical protein
MLEYIDTAEQMTIEAKFGNAQSMQYLIDNGADINDRKHNAFYTAISFNNHNIVNAFMRSFKYLDKHGYPLRYDDRRNEFMQYLCIVGNISMIDKYLDYGILFNIKNLFGCFEQSMLDGEVWGVEHLLKNKDMYLKNKDMPYYKGCVNPMETIKFFMKHELKFDMIRIAFSAYLYEQVEISKFLIAQNGMEKHHFDHFTNAKKYNNEIRQAMLDWKSKQQS